MNKLILGFIFLILAVSVNSQTAPIKKKSYVDEQKILNVEASTPRAGYISAPYRKTDGNWYEKTDAGVEQLIIDTVAMLATKYDLENVSVDTVAEIATKYDLTRQIFAADFGFHQDSTAEQNHVNFQKAINYHIASGTPTVINIRGGSFRVGSLRSDAVDNEIWNIEQTQGLLIKGAGKGKTIIIGERDHVGGASSPDFIRIRNAQNIGIEGVTFQSEFKRLTTMVFADAENSVDSNMTKGIYVVVKSLNGNATASNNLKIFDCEFKYLYGIAIHVNDDLDGVTIENTDFTDCYRDCNGGIPQPTGMLINDAKNLEVVNCDFFNIIDLAGSLAHSMYLSGVSDALITRTRSVVDSSLNINLGSGGLQLIGTENKNVKYTFNYHRNARCNIYNTVESEISNNLFYDAQLQLSDCNDLILRENLFSREKSFLSFAGIVNVIGATENIDFSNNVFDFTLLDENNNTVDGNGLMWQSGISKKWTIKNNIFKHSARGFWLGRGASSALDSSQFIGNINYPYELNAQFIYLNKGNYNYFEKNNVYHQSNSNSNATPFRDGDDGSALDEVGNILVDCGIIGSSADPYSLVTNATVYFDHTNLAERDIGTKGNLPISLSTDETKRIEISGTGNINLSNYGNETVTGTPTALLAVEADGDVIEVDIASGMDAVVSDRSYVDNTAALVDLSSGQVYYNTTSSTFVVLP
tara:strand:+ start:10555 stop:12648 length:2094 start_codon:yes stop_codon:yes gene_type:complete